MSSLISSKVVKTELINWKTLQFLQEDSFKDLGVDAKAKLKNSLISSHFTQPFYVWQDSENILWCLDGKHRSMILNELINDGVEIPEQLPATFIDCADKTEAAKMVLQYSSIYAKITQQGLFDFLEAFNLNFEDTKLSIDLPDFDMLDFASTYNQSPEEQQKIIAQNLQEKFIVPPFSVLDTRQGYWQDRKRIWSGLFDSQATREDVELIAKSGQSSGVYELRNKMRESLGREPEWDEIISEAKKRGMHVYEGASIFDPVLAEVCYKWFCADGGVILDPFAGGSVRGIVASLLKFKYVGIDLRFEQVNENIKQAEKLKAEGISWIEGDSNVILDEISDQFDFVFSCPPYHDLEKYSDDAADLSNMDYDQFKAVYFSIIKKSISKLKENRFACFVVGDIRSKDGFYKSFVPDTIKAFEDAGARYYNEIILVNVAGSLPIRVGKQFSGYRKVGKMHQNVLVFYKGDPKKIKEEFPEINVEKDLQNVVYQPNIALSIVDD